MQQQKPDLSFWQIWNMCLGFFGIQFGFALQNGNVSRIFQTLGAEMDQIAILWVAAPLTGLLVQPIVGHFSDKTWTKLGRRRPFFLYGAIATTLALIFMPNSPHLWVAAMMLWILDAAINVTMEPFRAFVGDNLNKKQRPQGFAMQSFFIGVGAVVASALPWMMTNWFGVSNIAPEGMIPDSVVYSFYAGGVVLFLAVGWTILRSKEYSPDQLAAFEAAEQQANPVEVEVVKVRDNYWASGAAAVVIGVLFWGFVYLQQLDQNLYLLGALIASFGVLQWLTSWFKQQNNRNMLVQIIDDLYAMPGTMKQLAVVQFFSWFPLFAMWIYTTAAVTSHHYGTSDTTSLAYNTGADWVGVLFAVYNGFAAIAALIIPWLARRITTQRTHSINLTCGALGLFSFFWIQDPALLWLPMIGIGIAWASILSLPYAMLSNSLPAHKMGIYMGIFNIFIVLPQLLAAAILGSLLKYFFGGEAIYALALGGVSYLIAAVYVLFVRTSKTVKG
ncbi:MFS transporter [Alkalimonas mucilaginosa]|uniref:MFS transporter n=1 Tax=Alkalimonas mucilaginosa TaxID=3057676 RepID=A0ABU7JF35_9GAMM|nr:MFS transporter [Alkalimonas sp. MEB004]MEE2024255.1 MFS transporter [Alkalimonas sp. MEB004]